MNVAVIDAVFDPANGEVVVASAALFTTILGAFAALVWRAGSRLGRMELKLDHLEKADERADERLETLESKVGELREGQARLLAAVKNGHK